MVKNLTCIICPNGCKLEAVTKNNPDGTISIEEIRGASCPKGITYAKEELVAPRRTISTSILVKGGELPLASVRLTSPIPKGRLFEAMDEIKKQVLTAPVEAGTVVISHILGYDSDVIVTKSVK